MVALVDGQGRRGSGEAEVEQLGDRRGGSPAAPDEEDIARFQVAMDDPLPVGRGQRVGHLHRDPQRFVQRQARSLGARACASALQRFPVQELHDEKRGARFLADVEERADVRMGEPRDGARFAVEAFAELRVGGQRLGEHFDRDGAIETRVSAFVHLAHAARADLRGHFVDAEAGTGDEGQTLCRGLYGRVRSAGRDYS